MGDPEAFLREETPVKILPLDEMVKNLLALSRESWYDYAWSREPLEGKFTREQKQEYGQKAARCGRQEAEAVKSIIQTGEPVLSRAAEATQIDFSALSALADSLGITVSTPRVPNGGSHVIFAQYEEPDHITLFLDSTEKAEKLIQTWNLDKMLGYADIKALLLVHELFHVTEYRKRDSIYTQTEQIELWRKPFSNRSRIMCLGEIAGMEYAAQLLGITYTPYIFDVIMMYGYNQAAATALYEEITELAQTGSREEQ